MIAIIGAMPEEIQAFLKEAEIKHVHKWHSTDFHIGTFKNQAVVIVQSGIGKVLAAMTCQYLIDNFQPTKILFTGVAGALNSNYEIGDIVISDDLIQHDVDGEALGFSRGTVLFSDTREFKACEKLKAIAVTAKVDAHKIYEGRILTGDQFFTKKKLNDSDYLFTELAGDAIEMEGAAIAQVAIHNQIPFLIIRTISDKADENASEDFTKLLPVIAHNSFIITSHLLENL